MVKATHLGEKTLNKSWSSRLGFCREASSLTQEKLSANKTQRGNAGQMTLGRPRHVKRMKKEQIDIGTRNVNTVLKAGKMQEVVNVGKMTFRSYKEHEYMQLEECNTE